MPTEIVNFTKSEVQVALHSALFQFVKSMVVAAVLAGLFSAAVLVENGHGIVNWPNVGNAFLLAFIYSICHSIIAFYQSLPSNEQRAALRENEYQMHALRQSLAVQQSFNHQPAVLPSSSLVAIYPHSPSASTSALSYEVTVPQPAVPTTPEPSSAPLSDAQDTRPLATEGVPL